jgi:hypothetical protein
LAQQFLYSQAVMLSDILEHAVQQAHLERTMIGNADVMFATTLGGYLNMGTGLPLSLLAQMPEGVGKLGEIAVPRNLHAASTSSRL